MLGDGLASEKFEIKFPSNFLVFFVLDSCGQKCRLASSANDGRALKLSVRGRSSVTAARGDTPPVRRVLSDTLCPRDFLVTPPLPVHFPVHPRTLLMLAPPGDTSNLVICVLHLLLVQYPSTLFPGCLEQEARAGGCWKLCSTSPLRAYITRMERS